MILTNVFVWNNNTNKYDPYDGDVTTHVHNPGEPVKENDKYDDNGAYTFELNTYCQDDDELVDTKTVVLDRTPAVEAVPGTDGNIEYFTDDKGTDDSSDDDVYVWNNNTNKYDPYDGDVTTHVHNPGEPVKENDKYDDNGAYTFELNTYCQDDGELVDSKTITLDRTPAVEAVPGADGNIEYFTDDKGTDDLSDDDVYVWNNNTNKYDPYNGDVTTHVHNPGEPVHENDKYDDNGVYSFELNTYCQDDDELVDTKTVVLDRTPAVEAVPGTDGNIEYFTNDKGTDDPSDDDVYVWNNNTNKYDPYDGDVTTHVHNPGEPVKENDKYDDNGAYTFELNTYCQDDGELVDSKMITLDRTPAVEAVPGTDGNIEYFTDDKGNDDPSDDVIYVWDDDTDKYVPFNGDVTTHVHNPGEPVHENDVCDETGNIYQFELNTYCQADNERVGHEVVVLDRTPAVEAVPGTDGNIEYFTDNKGTDDPSDDVIYVWDDDADKYVPFDDDVTTHVHNPGTPVKENDQYDPDTDTYTFELNTYCQGEDQDLLDTETVTLDRTPAVEAVPGTDGNIEYFTDDKGTDDPSDDDVYVWNNNTNKYDPYDGDVTTHVHNPGEPVKENDKYDDNGVYSFELNTYCQDDGELVDSKTITLDRTPAVEAVPGTDGNIEYFTDDKGTDDPSDDVIYVWDDDTDKYVPYDDDVTTHVHNPGEPVHENDQFDPDTNTYTFELNTYCQADGDLINSETVTLTKHDATEPTDTTFGNVEFYDDGNGNNFVWNEDANKFETLTHSITTIKINQVAPGCTTNGSYDLLTGCTNCGEIFNTEHVVIDALGHDWQFKSENVTTAPTCTKSGTATTEYECARCHETRTIDTTLKALGHKDADKDGYCDVCHEEIGFHCSKCDWYNENKDKPGAFGIVVKIIHIIVHMVESINHLT